MAQCTRPTCNRQAKTKGYCQLHAKALGLTHNLIPTHHAQHHLHTLETAGNSHRDISEATGIAMRVLKNIKTGTQKHVRKDTLDKLTKTRILPKMRPIWPLTRRLQALRAIGWKETELANQLNIPRSTISKWCLQPDKQPTTSVHIDHKIRAFYDVHQSDEARPENTRTAKHRWPAPMDWDDIDDPGERAIASRFFHSSGQCGRGHELYEFNTFKADRDSSNQKCKSCVSARSSLSKWRTCHSEDDVQWLSDVLFETYRRGENPAIKELVTEGVCDDRAA